MREMSYELARRGDYGEGNPDELADARVEFLWGGDATRSDVVFWNDRTYDVIAQRTQNNGLVITYADITERERAGQALKESHERQRLIFESSPFGISVISVNDPNKRIYVNSRFVQMFGAQSAEQLLERSAFDSFADPEVGDKLAEVASNGSFVTDAEVERFRLDGSRWWCHLHRRPIWF
jgi:PAS domain S-box-containing protein